MPKWRLVHIILGQCRWEDIARHEILIWTKNQTPKNTSFKVNCTFVTTSLIFPQAYESLHTHAHTLALPCVLEQNEWGVSLLYRLLWYRQVSRCVCVCIFLSMHDVRTGQYRVQLMLCDDWKKATKCFGYCTRSWLAKLLFSMTLVHVRVGWEANHTE